MKDEYGLLKIARFSIEKNLGVSGAAPETHPFAQEKGASFVTLKQKGQLRGCIGTLEAHRAIREDVSRNAVSAAFSDPRFHPLSLSELSGTRIEVSLLSEAEPMHYSSEKEALSRLRPMIDGVVLQCGARRSTFLPQVWEELSEAREFMQHLKQKAGLPADFWSDEIKLSRYTVRKWAE